MWRIQLFELNYDGDEERAVAEVLQSKWLTMGEKTSQFEAQFSSTIVDGAYATAVSSGTAALHMAMLALGVGSGDEVIVPALTFVADMNVVRIVGGTPVLVDCTSLDDWNVSPLRIEEALTPRTKAVVIVHYAGYPCALGPIVSTCRSHNLYLIEDAAHAPGASYHGKKVGTFGDIGCFSFFTNKNISIGEGGMFVTGTPELHQKARYLRSHGMTTLTLDRFVGRATTYDVVQPGLNYRLDEIRAALGLAQLRKLAAANRYRGFLVRHYQERLSQADALRIPFRNGASSEVGADVESAYHIFPVLLAEGIDRERVIARLKEAGIQTSIHYPSAASFSAYRGVRRLPTPHADAISSRVLTLPLHPRLSVTDVDLVCDNLLQAING